MRTVYVSVAQVRLKAIARSPEARNKSHAYGNCTSTFAPACAAECTPVPFSPACAAALESALATGGGRHRHMAARHSRCRRLGGARAFFRRGHRGRAGSMPEHAGSMLAHAEGMRGRAGGMLGGMSGACWEHAGGMLGHAGVMLGACCEHAGACWGLAAKALSRPPAAPGRP